MLFYIFNIVIVCKLIDVGHGVECYISNQITTWKKIYAAWCCSIQSSLSVLKNMSAKFDSFNTDKLFNTVYIMYLCAYHVNTYDHFD